MKEDLYSKYTLYDKSDTAHTPVVIAAWLKNTTNITGQWGDGRLLCMRAENITAGSRNATEIPSEGAIMQTGYLSFVGAITLGIMVYLGKA